MQPPPTVTVAVLDQYEDDLFGLIQAALPSGWAAVQARSYDEDAQLEAVQGADVVFAGWAPVTRRVIQGAERLRFVQKMGVGVDRVDLDACRERGVLVARLAGVNAVPVAEHTVLFMLAALRQLPTSDRRMRKPEWFKEEARAFQRELRGRTVGLIGLGYVGRAVALRLRGFEVEVLYHDIREFPRELESELGVTRAPLDELIARSDIVSLHVPLTADTRHLLDARRLKQMKPGAVLVNCARGGIVDEAALVQALREGRLAAAALDVFPDEPRVNPELLGIENLILTPHVAGATAENFAFVVRRAVDNAQRVLNEQPLQADDIVTRGISA